MSRAAASANTIAEAATSRPCHATSAGLGPRDRVQAVVLAYESGLVEPGARP